MATYTYCYPNETGESYTSSKVSPLYASFEVSKINQATNSNIPKNAVITKVTASANAKQEFSSSEGSLRIYWGATKNTDNIVKELYYETFVVTNSYKQFSVDLTNDFYTSGENVGKVSVSGANYFSYDYHAIVIRKWYYNSFKITFEYYIPTYTLTVNATTGGTVTGTPSGDYEAGTQISITAVPNAGYRFKQWSDGDTSNPKTGELLWNASYTAEFVRTVYSISYNGNGATSGSVASQSATTAADTTLAANAFKKQYTVTLNLNYSGASTSTLVSEATFKGWEDQGNITVSEGANKGESFTCTQFDAPYYANTYSDLYNAFKYNKQSLVNHYANYGRNENRKGTGTPRGVYPDKAVVNTLNGVNADNGAIVNLYAQWSAMTAVTLPTPTRKGYNFLGWYTALSGGTKVSSNYTPSGNVTLYAQWEVVKINKIFVGVSQPKEIYIGTSKVKAVYRGTTKIYG